MTDLAAIRDRWLRDGESDNAVVTRLVDLEHDPRCDWCAGCDIVLLARPDIAVVVGEYDRLRAALRELLGLLERGRPSWDDQRPGTDPHDVREMIRTWDDDMMRAKRRALDALEGR